MNKNKISLVIFAASAILLLNVLLLPSKKTQPTSNFSSDEILSLLQEQKHIATTEVTIRKMGIYDSNTEFISLNPTKWKIGKRVCVIPVDVVLRYGIDLSKLTNSSIRFLPNDSVMITLPQPEIIDRSFIPSTNRNEILTISTGLRDNIGESTIQQIKNMVFEDVVNQEDDVKKILSEDLKHNTELCFSSLLRSVGLIPVFEYK